VTSAAGTNRGSSIEGMPSFGGPPDRISEKSTDVLEKSVFVYSHFQDIGMSAARADAANRTNTATMAPRKNPLASHRRESSTCVFAFA